MKKFLLFLAPLLIAITIFFGILFFLDRKTGKGALLVTSVPKSRVYLENKLIGTTPFCACDLTQMLPVGDYAIKLVPQDGNFRPFEEKITINKDILLEKAGLEKKREENQIDKDSSEKQRSVSPSQIPTISSKPRDNEIAQPSTFQEPSDGSVSPTFTASPTPTSNLVPTTDKPGGKDPDSNQLPFVGG